MPNVSVSNHGPLITASNYWGSETEQAGKVWCSVNAGCIRVLVPRDTRALISDCRGGQYAVLSRGPWPAMRLADAVEIMWEDGSSSPFAMHLSPEAFDLLPGPPGAGAEWTIAVWDCKKGRPHMAVQRRCYWRRVPRLPWMQPWEGDR